MSGRPNVVLIMNDDMGFSDLGCYGGEVQTPNLNRLAENGLRFTQFYNTPRCAPSRASLFTGLYSHQTGIGVLTENQLPDGYEGDLSHECITIAEALRSSGYSTYMAGKWHVCNDGNGDKSNWPLQRGFDRFYGTIAGAVSYYMPRTLTSDNENIEVEARDPSYYLTDAISEKSVEFIHDHVKQRKDSPFFLYVAYTAPHWPLHAKPNEIERYKSRFSEGWDSLREQRMERMIEKGIIDAEWRLSPRDETRPPWTDSVNKDWEQRRMEVYAAQIDHMDQGIGSIVSELESSDLLEDTLIIFLSDNGGCAEVLQPGDQGLLERRLTKPTTKDGRIVDLGNDPAVMPGGEESYQSYGVAWANLSNTPFRLYKHWTHEGGISTPFIAHWPKGIRCGGELRRTPSHIIDVMPTILEVCGIELKNVDTKYPIEGRSLTGRFDGDGALNRKIFWEHEGNAAVRDDRWKLVRKYPDRWELYDIEDDRTELNDLSELYPDTVEQMKNEYSKWTQRCGVIPWERILQREAKKSTGTS